MMPQEIVYDAEPQLSHPRRFFGRLRSDLAQSVWLTLQLLRQNLRAKYSSSMLGYVWLLASPLSLAVVWIALNRAGIVSFAPTRIPYSVHVIAGLFLWAVFLRALNAPLQHLNASRHILSRINFPWEAIVLASWMEVLLEFAIYLIVLAVVLLAYGLNPLLLMVSVPACAMLLLLGAAAGLLLAPLGLLYDDVPRAVGVITYGLFFLTPVIYPPPVDEPGSLTVFANPVGALLVAAREMMTGVDVTYPAAALIWSVVTLVAFAVGAITFRLSIPHLVSKL